MKVYIGDIYRVYVEGAALVVSREYNNLFVTSVFVFDCVSVCVLYGSTAISLHILEDFS